MQLPVSEPPPFVVFAMPRSRTKWLSTFLAYGDWQCGHDELRHCRSLDDVASWLAQPFTGTVETARGGVLAPVAGGCARGHAAASGGRRGGFAAARGLVFDDAPMTAMLRDTERKLDQIEGRLPGVLAVSFDDISTEGSGCARVFEHCLGLPHDHAWWAACDPVNIQIDLSHLTRYFAAYRPQVKKLVKIAKRMCIAGMKRAPREADGVTFQHEPFRRFWDEARPLTSEHAIQAGEAPDYRRHSIFRCWK